MLSCNFNSLVRATRQIAATGRRTPTWAGRATIRSLKNNMPSPKDHPDFITITCLEWKHILANDAFKDIIIGSLRFLSQQERIRVFAFVIMDNHQHLIWQILGDHKRDDVQRDFLKFTSQQIIKHLRNDSSPLSQELYVGAKDRKHQVWERDPLSIPLISESFFRQKLEYIHKNPVTAGICRYPEEYKYSSAGFYYKGARDYDFLIHHEG
jgi:putative transposase